MNKTQIAIETLMNLIEEGEYTVNVETAELFNKRGKKLGKVGADSGLTYYQIKGISFVGAKFWAVVHGYSIEEVMNTKNAIYYLDDNKQNMTADNIVVLPKKGAKDALEEIRQERRSDLEPELIELFDELDTIEQDAEDFTQDELQARRIMHALNAGKSIKEVAEQFNVSKYKVYDIRRGKSHGKATEDLRVIA